MTEREFFNAIANDETMSDELKEFASAKLTKMDAALEKKRNTPSKVAIENEPLIERIINEILTDEPKTAADVAQILGVSVQKASSLLRAVVTKGAAVQGEVKIPKKGPTKTYAKSSECADCKVSE